MAIVAVPGGTGNVGRAIVDALLATGKHQVKILSRSANAKLEEDIGAPIIAVDYADVDAVVKVLEDNKIDTVISAIAMHSIDGTPPREIELIRAADRSKTTKRMVSSEWGVPNKIDPTGAVASVAHKVNARKELEQTRDLEYTVFYNGYFMDYWGFPGVKSYLARVPLVSWIDMENNMAAIPGSGDKHAIFTHTRDVAKFVAANLDLPKWETETFVCGDRLTFNEFLALAEEAKGTKFNVAYDSLEKLQKGETTELPGQAVLYPYFPKEAMHGMLASFGVWFDKGLFDFAGAKFLNETFPDIKPLKMKEMLEKAWKKA